MLKAAVIIPTLNGGEKFRCLLESISNQSYRPWRQVVIDSESNDQTVALAKLYGFEVISIKRPDFNHGATRQMGIEMMPEVDIVIFMTQDAILDNNDALVNLIACFESDDVGAAYGQQLPHLHSGPLGAHARLFNYPATSMLKTFEDAKKLGIKTAFISNSFAAYRRETLISVGGFPRHTILSEDTYVAAKMLLAGWKVSYCAEAKVYHSHDYNFIQEFKRYFDIGAFHACEPWIREKFGKAEGEGLKFVLSEAKYLFSNGKGYLLPSAFSRTCLKYLGYRLGMKEKVIPVSVKKYLSMHRRFWDQ